MNNWPTLIKALREKMIISQTELAELIGSSFLSVNRWENGHSKPTIKMRRKLHALFIKYGIEEKQNGNKN